MVSKDSPQTSRVTSAALVGQRRGIARSISARRFWRCASLMERSGKRRCSNRGLRSRWSWASHNIRGLRRLTQGSGDRHSMRRGVADARGDRPERNRAGCRVTPSDLPAGIEGAFQHPANLASSRWRRRLWFRAEGCLGRRKPEACSCTGCESLPGKISNDGLAPVSLSRPPGVGCPTQRCAAAWSRGAAGGDARALRPRAGPCPGARPLDPRVGGCSIA